MLAVSNTSPLSNLAFVERLDLLKNQVDWLVIPPAVQEELIRHPDPQARAAIETAIRDGWIEVKPTHDTSLRSVLLQHLHRGEAEAIALAVDLNAPLILIDELEGRGFATQAGLTVTGTLGVLLRAKRSGQLPSVGPMIHDLRTRARFFISPSLEKQVLAAAGEEV